jgi:hypothetical protein
VTGRHATPAVLGRALLVLASCGFLAWSLQRAISWDARAEPQNPPVQEYAIAIPPHPPSNAASGGNDIWVHDIIVDGQPVPLQALPRTGAWEDRGWTLIHHDDAEPAAIRIRGRHVTVSFLTSSSSGIVRVERDDDGWDVDLFHRDRPRTTLAVLDLADGQLVGHGRSEDQHPVRVALIAILVLLAAALFRPWRSPRALEIWVVLYLAVLHGLVWLTQSVGYNEDAHGYMEGFEKFVTGLSSFFPPGYSFFLAPWQALFPGATGLAITAAQHVAMVATLVGLSRVAREILPDDLATAGLLLAGSLSPTLFLPQVVLAENVALFGMAGAVWFASRPASSGTIRLDVASGVLVGWAALARVVPLAVVAIPLLLVHYGKRGSWTKAVRGTARVLLIAIVMMVMAAGWIWYRSVHPIDHLPREHEFSIANSTGYHLYNRVVREQQLLDRDGPSTRRLISLVDERFDGRVEWAVGRRLRESGMSYREIADLFGDVALEGIRRYPVRFGLYSAGMAWREYKADPTTHLPRWNTASTPVPALHHRVTLGLNASSILWRQENDKIFNRLWPMILWAPLAGLLVFPLLRGPFIFLAMLLVPAGYLFSSSSIEVFLERYVVCVVPFALVLVPAPLAAGLTLWRRVAGDEAGSAPL